MNDTVTAIVYNCMNMGFFLLHIILSAYCLHQFLRGFLIPVKKTVFTLIPAIGYVIVMTILKLMPLVISGTLAYAIGSASAIALSLAGYGKNMVQRLYIGITFFMLCYFCATVSSLGYSFSLWLSTALKIQTDTDALIYIAAQELLTLPIYFFILLLSIRILVKYYNSEYHNYTLSDIIMLILPGTTCVINMIFINLVTKTYEQQTQSSIIRFQYIGVFRFFSSLFFILLIVMSFVLFQNLIAKKLKEKNNLVLEHDIHNMKSHIHEMEHLYLEMKGFKHDFKNHIANLETLITRKEYLEASSYIDKTRHIINDCDYAVSSGNPVTDAIINQIYAEAAALKIPFEVEFAFPINASIDSFDLGILLNNALLNALEAAKAEARPFIKVTSYSKQNMYLIKIKNSFSRRLKYGTKGLPLTTKDDKDLHGIGLLNIEQIARKYSGDIDITVTGREFELTVMLKKDIPA